MASPRPIPPATKTGTASISGNISCASTPVDTGPIWPPASMPSTISPSTPMRTSLRASASAGAKHSTRAPDALTRAMAAARGSPPARMTWLTPRSAHTSISASSSGCMVIRLTPNGAAVRARAPAISASSSSGPRDPQATTPKPPALDTAATNPRSETHDIAPAMIACSLPSSARPRSHCRARRR